MFNIGPFELLVIFIIALIFIGPKKLPELARSLGKAFGELRKVTDDLTATLNKDIKSSLDETRLSSLGLNPQENPHTEPNDTQEKEPLPREENTIHER